MGLLTLGLVVDSVNIVSSSKLNCVFQSSVLLHSVQHQRRHYTSTACGNSLSLYRLNSTTLQQTDVISMSALFLIVFIEIIWITVLFSGLSGDATSLEYFKLFDPESGQVFLFLLVLTPRSLQVYRVQEVGFLLLQFPSLTNANVSMVIGQIGTFC